MNVNGAAMDSKRKIRQSHRSGFVPNIFIKPVK